MKAFHAVLSELARLVFASRRGPALARTLLPLFIVLAITAKAAAADFTYTTSNNQITITRYTGTNGAAAVSIPSTIDGLPVTRMGDSAFAGIVFLTSVTIPDSVNTVGVNAFHGCTFLISVTIPNSVTRIGEAAFSSFRDLTGVHFTGNAPVFRLGVFTRSYKVIVYYLSGTTGWTATAADRPTALRNPQALATGPNFGVRAGQFGFTITGTAGIPVVVEATTDLINPIWTPISTNTLTSGSSPFTDPNWASYPSRTCRFRSP